MIYYQPKGGTVNSVNISNKQREKYLLEGLQRGVTYNISIVAWSYVTLPSPLVGPINVIPGTSRTVVHPSSTYYRDWVNYRDDADVPIRPNEMSQTLKCHCYNIYICNNINMHKFITLTLTQSSHFLNRPNSDSGGLTLISYHLTK